MDITAAIAPGIGLPLSIEQVELRRPGPGEVLVEMKASGLCHTDLSVMEGKFPVPLPAILGHEGAGRVLECGAGVENVKPGDHVILNNLPHCGHCRPCNSGKTSYCEQIEIKSRRPSPFSRHGVPLSTMGSVAGFASHTVLDCGHLTPIAKDIPFESAALVPCGVMTGVGAAVFNAKVTSGSSVLIFGMGSIGLNVVQAARMSGAARIVAIDTNAAKAEVALSFGATDFVNPKSTEIEFSKHVLELIGGSADYAFECAGSASLLAQALGMVNPYWGVCIAVGIASFDQVIQIPAPAFYFGRTLRGTFLGDGNPVTDTPRIIEWYQQGKLKIDELVTHRLPLARINDGFDLMKRGESIRSVIMF